MVKITVTNQNARIKQITNSNHLNKFHMKNQIKIIIIAFTVFLGYNSVLAQNPSMTIAHTGLAPNDTLWVTVGDSIDFIYGSGGTHPMTSGQGTTSSPVFFPTITVSSSIPMVTFALNTVGTYIFHCATNPSNTNNWGTIIVQTASGINENAVEPFIVALFPNPTFGNLSVESELNEIAVYNLVDLNGKLLQSGNISRGINTLDVSSLPAGTYQVQIISSKGKVVKQFIKN